MWGEAGVDGTWRKFLEWREGRLVWHTYNARGKKRAVKDVEIFHLDKRETASSSRRGLGEEVGV